jgi:biopolymer transport protein ExbD
VAGRKQSLEGEDHGIDLAPMLDFVLNLLIFFIITTSFVKQTGVLVNKPEAFTAEHKESGNLLIGVRPDGQIWMDRKQLQLRELRPAIERLHIERPDDTVVIIADKLAPAGVVAKVMDEARKAGIKDVAISADVSASG